MMTLLSATFIRFLEDRRQRTLLRRMLDRDDRMLEDIGLERSALIEALGQPFGARLREHAIRRSELSFGLDRRR